MHTHTHMCVCVCVCVCETNPLILASHPRKGNRENTPAIKDCNGRIIIDSIEKGNSLNFCYLSVFSSEGNIPNIQGINSSEPFTIDTKIIRKRIAAIGKNQSVGPDCVSGEILKLGGEAMIPYLA